MLPRVLLPLLLAFLALGCRPTVRPTCDVPDQGNLTLEATERLNPDERGRALPTIIRIYQLGTLGPMEIATFEQIWRTPEDTLGDALLGADELTIYPGETRSRMFDRNPEANYIVGVAIVRRPQGEAWRTILELPPPANELRCAAQSDDAAEEPPPPPQVRLHFFIDGYRIEGAMQLTPVEEGGCAPGDLGCLRDQASENAQPPEQPEAPEAPEAPDAPAPEAPEAPSP